MARRGRSTRRRRPREGRAGVGANVGWVGVAGWAWPPPCVPLPGQQPERRGWVGVAADSARAGWRGGCAGGGGRGRGPQQPSLLIGGAPACWVLGMPVCTCIGRAQAWAHARVVGGGGMRVNWAAGGATPFFVRLNHGAPCARRRRRPLYGYAAWALAVRAWAGQARDVFECMAGVRVVICGGVGALCCAAIYDGLCF
jgi:hypothetical protein